MADRALASITAVLGAEVLIAHLTQDLVGVDSGRMTVGGEHHVDRVTTHQARVRYSACRRIGRRERKWGGPARCAWALFPESGRLDGVNATVLPLNDQSLALLHIDLRWCDHRREVYGR
jgi:hypothetical protein